MKGEHHAQFVTETDQNLAFATSFAPDRLELGTLLRRVAVSVEFYGAVVVAGGTASLEDGAAMNPFWGGIAIILLLRIVNYHDSAPLSPWLFFGGMIAWGIYSGYRGWRVL